MRHRKGRVTREVVTGKTARGLDFKYAVWSKKRKEKASKKM